MNDFRILLLLILLLPGGVFAQYEHSPDGLVEAGFRRYGLNSALIEFEISGSRCGKEVLYFDHDGWRSRLKSDFVNIPEDLSHGKSRLEMLIGLIDYKVNLKLKEGRQMPNTRLLSHFQNGEEKELYKLDSLVMREMGAEYLGEKEVLGRTCQVFRLDILGTVTWIWKGIVLKMSVDFQGMNFVKEAVSIRENVLIAALKFEVPKGTRMKFY